MGSHRFVLHTLLSTIITFLAVDSCFLSSFGRRKTWLVPVQYLLGLTMFVLSYNVDYYLGDGTEHSTPNITALTAMFFFLNFLAATQVGVFICL